VPTSVLLAVLAAAGLLALAPALVHRYDAAERLVAERALSTARVIERRRRPRTVPGPRPINPPRWLLALAAVPSPSPSPSPAPSPPSPASPAWGWLRLRSAAAARQRPRPPARRRHTPAIYRRRRVLAALVLLNVSELCGVGLLGPGFWIGSAPSLLLLGGYPVHLRNRALAERHHRRAAARRAAWFAARQAELRREAARRQALRREAARRAAAARLAASRESVQLSQRFVRGRAYEARVSGWY